METITPTHDVRQRILIEGTYKINIDPTTVESYFDQMIKRLDLKTYARPIISTPISTVHDKNQGYDAYVPMIDSGFAINIWTASKYLSVVFYSCDIVNGNDAMQLTKDYFKMDDINYQSF